ncbi:MAG TPA: serine hydrolase [Verrucomicrobiae bacterium]|nr:serine hydrolase [Verrucomicrobiae bacterium]
MVLGASHRGAVPIYPASVVKLFFLAAVQAWVSAGRLSRTRELRRACAAMIRESSNDATAYIVDLLTGTTGGPEMAPVAFRRWLQRRSAVQRYFERWDWPEFAPIRITQKTWEESPYGREQQSRRQVPNNRNRLTTDAVARLLWSIDREETVSKPACREMRRLLNRRLKPKPGQRRADNQIGGFLGEGLPADARLWSKAGWTSNTRHDAAIIELKGGRRFVLVVFSEGRKLAEDAGLLPALAKEAARLMAMLQDGPDRRGA